MPRVEGELPGNQPYLIHNNGNMKVCFINNIVDCSLTSILRLDGENELSMNWDFIGLDNYNFITIIIFIIITVLIFNCCSNGDLLRTKCYIGIPEAWNQIPVLRKKPLQHTQRIIQSNCLRRSTFLHLIPLK